MKWWMTNFKLCRLETLSWFKDFFVIYSYFFFFSIRCLKNVDKLKKNGPFKVQSTK